MIFNKHSELEGKHAFLSASQFHWINYDAEKIANRYKTFLATQRGTQLHEFACHAIKLGIRLPKTDSTLNRYVNDAIGFKMKPEQVLYYSENCFGTADAIAYRNNQLRIHDLKTGEVPAHMEQLLIYAALFCLEYKIKPGELEFIELRIYQSNDIVTANPTAEDILPIMDKIQKFSKLIDKLKDEEK